MLSFKQLCEAMGFKDRVKEHLWKHHWKTDALMPAEEDHWNDMSHEDLDDFHSHVRDIVRHAEKHKIKSAKQAIDHYHEHQAKEMDKQTKKKYGFDRSNWRQQDRAGPAHMKLPQRKPS